MLRHAIQPFARFVVSCGLDEIERACIILRFRGLGYALHRNRVNIHGIDINLMLVVGQNVEISTSMVMEMDSHWRRRSFIHIFLMLI